MRLRPVWQELLWSEDVTKRHVAEQTLCSAQVTCASESVMKKEGQTERLKRDQL